MTRVCELRAPACSGFSPLSVPTARGEGECDQALLNASMGPATYVKRHPQVAPPTGRRGSRGRASAWAGTGSKEVNVMSGAASTETDPSAPDRPARASRTHGSPDEWFVRRPGGHALAT